MSSKSPQDKLGGALRCVFEEALKVTHNLFYLVHVRLSKHSILALHSLQSCCWLVCSPETFRSILASAVFHDVEKHNTKQVGVFAICLVQISVRTLAILTEGFCGFSQPLHVNARIVPQLHHGCFLPNAFQFVVTSDCTI
jgi:hypothetical protein